MKLTPYFLFSNMWLHLSDSFTMTRVIPYAAIINFLLLCIASQALLPPTVAKATGPETDRLALLALKDKLTNSNPEALLSWNHSVHFCKWDGVSCNSRHMRVETLNLTNQNLGGTLAPALGNLTFLKLVRFSYNGLHGEIPKEIGRLKRLQALNLSYNDLEGEVPVEIANCSKLEVIIFRRNKLIGKVPFWFGSMLQLTQLSLAGNKLFGTIPPSLGNLSSLERMSLAGNNLQGSITQTLGGLPNLKVLFLGANNLSGIITPSIYNLSKMENIDLSENHHLLGSIPSNIDLLFPNLQIFAVGGNSLTGTIPVSLSNISQLQIFDIYGNRFGGPVPTTLGRLKNLRALFLDFNNLGSGRGHGLDFLSSLTNCSQLQRLTMTKNGFGGVLPYSIGNFSSQLEILGMAGCQISGGIPKEIGQLVGLSGLGLDENLLHGTIPVSIGKLTNIRKMFFENNQLFGNIPDVFGNLTMLFDVGLHNNNFQGSIPSTLKHCKNMQQLYLYGNNLSGNIPNQTFGQQEGLIALDISYNSLTGSLPSDFGNLEHLVELGLSENNLSGDIPIELGKCSGLSKLNMSGNFFQGSIPLSFGSLKSLESLDLSRNNLSGTIPGELKDLPILKALNLSFNNLHGEVPKGGVFDNITAISLTRNEDLCGGIPQLKLPACSNKPKKPFKVIIIFIIVISSVFICFVIFINIYLRRKPKELSSSSSSMQNKLLRVSYRELHEATNGFSSSNLVGIGSFGSVYKGTLHHYERPIAVKVLNLQTHGASKSFITECKALSKVRHRNLLKVLTSCSSVDYKGADFKALIFEFMPNGSLEDWLSTNEQCETRNLYLNFMQRLDIAIDVAHALDYLHHDSEEAIVHCDIKPSNVLLDDEMAAHLGDFGLAKLLHGVMSYSSTNQNTSSTIKGTIGYIPPEYGAGGPVTPQGDIYSYGILLLEMLTGKKPTDSMFGEDLRLHKFCKLALPEGVIEIVDSSLLVAFERDQRDIMQKADMELKIRESLVSFARIGVACFEELPSERMGIKDVLVELLAIKKRLSPLDINLVIHN